MLCDSNIRLRGLEEHATIALHGVLGLLDEIRLDLQLSNKGIPSDPASSRTSLSVSQTRLGDTDRQCRETRRVTRT